MSKSKSDTKAAKATKPEILSKAKDAGVAKPAQSVKEKSKKQKLREPTPESSEEDDSDQSSSESESEVEAEDKKPVSTNKMNGSKKAPAADKRSGADSDDSDSSESSEEEVAPVESEKPGNIAAEDAEDSEDSEDDSESDDEVSAEPKVSKRKAEEVVEPTAKKSKVEGDDTSQGQNLFVGNLSWNVDEAWLRETFEEHGTLSSVRLITEKGTGRSKGFGYVEFVDAEEAANAVQAKNGSELDGRPLKVDFATSRPEPGYTSEKRRKAYGDQISEPTDTLFVGNLSFDLGAEELKEAFSSFGNVVSVRLPTDFSSGAPKGFGYVSFGSVEEAMAGFEGMQGVELMGRLPRLDYSQPRQGNDARGRGGFGGRGGARGGRGGGGGFGGGFGGRGGRGGPRGGGRGGRGASTNRGGFRDFSGSKQTFAD